MVAERRLGPPSLRPILYHSCTRAYHGSCWPVGAEACIRHGRPPGLAVVHPSPPCWPRVMGQPGFGGAILGAGERAPSTNIRPIAAGSLIPSQPAPTR